MQRSGIHVELMEGPAEENIVEFEETEEKRKTKSSITKSTDIFKKYMNDCKEMGEGKWIVRITLH